MIFGDASFMGVPWETLVKLYRENLGSRAFSSLSEYPEDFFSFLENHPHLFPAKAQDDAIFHEVAQYALNMQAHAEQGAKGQRQKNRALRDLIDHHYKKMKRAPLLNNITEKEFKSVSEKHKSNIQFIIDKVFESFTVSEANKKKLKFIFASAFTRLWSDHGPSGIVFAGFGKDEHFPQLRAFRCRGIYENRCSRVPAESETISRDQSSAVVPFAQTEMVQTFMLGYDPELVPIVDATMKKALKQLINETKQQTGDQNLCNHLSSLSKTIIDTFSDQFNKWVQVNHLSPILRIVDVLAKDELAELVETLITMESLKKRITAPVESVSGPVDVAVISKGEGLIWIRRKHYFDPEINLPYRERVKGVVNDG